MKRKIRKVALVGLALVAFYGLCNTEIVSQRDESTGISIDLPTGEVGHSMNGWYYCQHGEC